MLARLLAYCVEQVALDGEQERVFAFAAECTARTGMRGVLDAPYRAYVWDALLAHPDVYVGVATKRAPPKNERRFSVLGKATPASLAPDRVAPGPLAALQDAHGDALRVAVDVQRVRRLLTGTDDVNYLSPAAYVVLQHVSRARAAGLTVVELGKATHYDQKTVFYLVKALVERDLVVKFAAPEMGHVSNYVVGKAFLADNPQWQAQQNALGDAAHAEDAQPKWVDVDRLATIEQQRESDDEGEDALPELAVEGPTSEGSDMLAFPLLSEEQSKVWLHSRQDLLRQRLFALLRASPAHMTPRRLLATRLGLRSVPGTKRALIAFLNRNVAAGYVERMRVQLGHLTPLYLRATERGLHALPDDGTADAAPDASLASWIVERETSVEQQLVYYISACGSRGCTLHELATHFHASTDVKRMIEQILARQTAPPYTPLTICAPFEQEGRERRIRYYTFAGFQVRCADDGVDLAAALGLPPQAPIPTAAAPLPPTLPGEAAFADAEAYAAALTGLQRHELGFFRDAAGPVALRKRKAANVDPVTGQPKRGRPRKIKAEDQPMPAAEAEAVAPAPAPVPAMVPAPRVPDAWAQLQPAPVRVDGRRTNMSTFHRSTLLLSAVENAGGAVDELDVPRLLQHAGGPDLADRTTRTKVIDEAVRRGLLRTTKVQRDVGDAHRQRTILYLPTLATDQLRTMVQAVVESRSASRAGVTKRTDVTGAEVGLLDAAPATLPWSTSDKVPVAPADDAGTPVPDPVDDPATRHAFARLSHVLRAFYGFVHGAAARLHLFHAAAATQPTSPIVDLAWFWTACPVWTYVALVPVKLRTRTVVRTVLGEAARTMPVHELPEPVAQRLGLRRIKAHALRFQSYAEQLVALGVAVHEGAERFRLCTDAHVGGTQYNLRTREGLDAYWAALRAAYAPAAGSGEGDGEEGAESGRGVGRASTPPLPFLRTHHAWQDTFHLRRPQKAFLRRYSQHEPTDALVARLAHACLAPAEAVAAFLRTPRRAPRSVRDVLAEKVAARRAQRATEFDALLAAEQAEHRVAPERQPAVERLLAQHRRRYLHGREALTPAELQARLRSTLAARPARRGRTGVRRRARRTLAWTHERQELLRDAYVVLYEAHARRGDARTAPDPAPLLQLVEAPADAAAWATWRARWKQLVHTPTEVATLRVLVRAWAPLADAARADGTLPPVDAPIDVARAITHLRAHLDKSAALADAGAARDIALPRIVQAADAARWVPLVPRTSLALSNANQPMVHRVQAQRSHAASVATFAAPRARAPSPDLAACLAEASVRMAVGAAPGTLAHLSNVLGDATVDTAIARLVARRVVRVVGERQGRVQLAFADEHARALQEPIVRTTFRDAQRATAALGEDGGATALPCATDGETAAYLAWLDAGIVRAEVDTAPLVELRKRTQLNARTLDDAETECRVALRPTSVIDARAVVPEPAAVETPLKDAESHAVPVALAEVLAAVGAEGVCVAALDEAQRRAAAAALDDPLPTIACVGWDDARIVARAHLDAWTLPTDEAGSGTRFVPSAWRDVHGAVRRDVWLQRAGLVHAWCVARAGVSLAHLVVQLAPALDRREVVEVVEALVVAQLVHVRAPGAWRVTCDADVVLEGGAAPWWSMSFP
ncbi:oxalate--CoA ligase [Malassezia brasiliensis]|uniref:Oxalate--CoA ligase n=1 Tax=Malassezia brasiliensis TaxID=1821822 RepID=A0AAF0DUS0_9BASI|nr:oxalate--CoA ligase [Malassezia brasiliensis]